MQKLKICGLMGSVFKSIFVLLALIQIIQQILRFNLCIFHILLYGLCKVILLLMMFLIYLRGWESLLQERALIVWASSMILEKKRSLSPCSTKTDQEKLEEMWEM